MNKLLYILAFIISLPSICQKIDLKGEWEYKSDKNSEWQSCQLPNNIYDILFQEDVLKKEKSKELEWIGNTKFYFRKKFELPLDYLDHNSTKLVLDKVDTYCAVYINGDLIDTLDNYFIPSNLEIKNNLLPGENEIMLVFIPVSEVHKKQLDKENISSESRRNIEEGMRTRKPAYMLDWDLSPNFPSFGVYGDLEIVSFDAIEIHHVNYRLISEADGRAKIQARLNLETFLTGSYIFKSDLFSEETNILTGKDRTVTFNFFIDDFKFWYPKGFGEQNFYQGDIEVSFKGAGEKKHQLLFSIPFKFGFHTIELIQNPKDENDFNFEIEGLKVDVNGGFIVPNTIFPNRLNDKDYSNLFGQIESENINLIRVWGGGEYINKKLLDFCDSTGVMVWQDLTFSGFGYRADSNFVQNIRKEVNYQFREISSHPSSILFVGSDDVMQQLHDETAYLNAGLDKKSVKVLKKNSKYLFEKIIPFEKNKFYSKLYYKPYAPDFNWKEQNYSFGKLKLLK